MPGECIEEGRIPLARAEHAADLNCHPGEGEVVTRVCRQRNGAREPFARPPLVGAGAMPRWATFRGWQASTRGALDAQPLRFCQREINVDMVPVRVAHVDLAQLEIVQDTDPVRYIEAPQALQKPFQIFRGEREMLQPQVACRGF